MWGPSHFHRMISDMLSINICYSLECIETTESVYIKKKKSALTGFVWNTNMAAVYWQLFWKTNMAAMTSWQNALLWHLVISSAKSKLPNKTICVSCDPYLNFLSLGSISVKDRMVKECPAWAEKGYCETYEKFMIRNCRTSCMAGGYVNGKRQLSLRK